MSLQNTFHTKTPTNLPSPLANAHKQRAGGMVGFCETPTTHLPSFNITYLPSATNQKYKHGRCMVGVCPTPTIPQSPYPSAFQWGDGRLVGVFAKNFFSFFPPFFPFPFVVSTFCRTFAPQSLNHKNIKEYEKEELPLPATHTSAEHLWD